MTKDQIIDIAKIDYQKMYDKYKDKWVLGIYLWWSITSDDFDPEHSDIDAIAIVENNTDLKYEAEMKDYLSNESAIKGYEPSCRFITIDELNGESQTWYLTKFIEPAVIVLDMPFRIHIAWEKHSRDEFKLSNVSFDKMLVAIAQKAKDIYLPFTWKFDQKYFLKPVSRLFYYINQDDWIIKEPFSYIKLLTYKNIETDDLIKKFMELKNKNWNTELFNSYLPDFEVFLDRVIQKYS